MIGVAKAKGSVFGQSQDKFVMVPIYSYFKTYGNGLHDDVALLCKSGEPEAYAEAEDEVRMLLRAYRHIRPGQDDTFSMFGSDTLPTAWKNLTGAIAGMAFGVVSVFLVVGGIVIMNIMLAVVTERTHEIGIRKSAGRAPQRYPKSIPGGILRTRGDRRTDRGSYRVPADCSRTKHDATAHGDASVFRGTRRRSLGRSGLVLWNLSGAASLQARPYRCAPRGVIDDIFFLSFRNNTMLALRYDPRAQTAQPADNAGRHYRDRYNHRRGFHPDRIRWSCHECLKSFGPNAIIVTREPAFRTSDLTPEERARKQFKYETR